MVEHVSIFALWLPILVSAVFVFIVSSLMHMLLTYHQSDLKKLPDEAGVMETLRGFNVPPGDYYFPHATGMKETKSPEYMEKMKKGPVGIVTFYKDGDMSMVSSLIMWFLYSVLISIFAAYISGRALGANAYYLEVFRFVGATSFIGYSMALLQNSIWYKKNWCATLKSMFDGLIYALVTAGVFGWLWPR